MKAGCKRKEAITIQLPLEHEEKSSVRLALEVALHELASLHGLHVTDVPEVEYTWDIDTKDAIKLIEDALASEELRTSYPCEQKII